jgi:molybdopterin molybdotransferase
MIGVDEALQLVEQHAVPRAAHRLAAAEALGAVLDEDIVSTIDSPPYDKSQVDGFAVRCDDLSKSPAELRVLEEVTAGQTPTRPVIPGTATCIMTGAPIPDGSDAVVMVERTSVVPGNATIPSRVCIQESPRAGQNILRRGEAMRAGDVVLRRGHGIRSIEIGLLAELGVTDVRVTSRPTAAIISTGNELVHADETPGPGQIRNSNSPMLEAMVREAGAEARPLGIVRDTEADLIAAIRRGLECDVLLLSGGVSAGVLDLVPPVLRQLGVKEIFHKVQLKPGKPLWFGVHEQSGSSKLVFGLPGNPVSSLVCFELFVRPALARMAGKAGNCCIESAELTQAFRHHGARPTFFPGRTVRKSGAGLLVEPLKWRGSADLRRLADADVLICFEAGDYELPAGSAVKVRRL